MPSLRLIAGPNGSGKTTLTDQLRKIYHVPLGQYSNPDEIELSLKNHNVHSDDLLERSRLAQGIAKDLREMWLSQKISHSYESVMSHESHLEYVSRAKDNGFKTYLYYVCIDTPQINVQRVAQRFLLGGHAVPEGKILSRYSRSLKQLYDMVSLCRRAFFFDNTRDLDWFAEVNQNGILQIKESLYYQIQPQWFRENVLLKWDKTKVRVIR